jgi:hypothetical protein
MRRRYAASFLGKKVASIQVLGINSLKTLQPPLESVNGQAMADLVIDESVRKIDVVLERYVIVVDMARTGTVVAIQRAAAWQPSDKGPMPTARILFSDGSALDFKEPAKTKRVHFTVRTNGAA